MADDESSPTDEPTGEAGPPGATSPLPGAGDPARLRRNPLVAVVVVVVLAAVVAVGTWYLISRDSEDTTSSGPIEASDFPATPLEEGMSFATGAGPILDIYVDYQCSHCADLDAVIGTELASMVAAEEAELVLRPVKFLNRASGRGAAAVYCAASTGQAYDMHRRLLSDIAADFSPEGLTASAADMGIDEADFGACLADERTIAWVNGVTDTAVADGIQGTPAVFVDGTRLSPAELASGAAFREAVLAEGA